MDEQIVSYFNGELTPDECLAFLKRVELDGELKRQFVDAKNVYALSMLSGQADNKEESKDSYARFMRKNRKQGYQAWRLGLKIAGCAAAVALLVVSTYLLTLNYGVEPLKEEMFTLHVPDGQRLNLTLLDGTNVWLNAGTIISYPNTFKGSERRITIDGEAFLDVAEDKERPFIVSSGGIGMEVLGTSFNVYSYSTLDYVRVSLLEGSLNVYRESDKSERITLKPDQEVFINKDGMTVESIQDPTYFLWTEGIYSFYNEPLASILQKLEIYYDLNIEVKDPSIYSWEYTGKFRQSHGIDGILRIIQKIHKFKIEKYDDRNTIILSK